MSIGYVRPAHIMGSFARRIRGWANIREIHLRISIATWTPSSGSGVSESLTICPCLENWASHPSSPIQPICARPQAPLEVRAFSSKEALKIRKATALLMIASMLLRRIWASGCRCWRMLSVIGKRDRTRTFTSGAEIKVRQFVPLIAPLEAVETVAANTP